MYAIRISGHTPISSGRKGAAAYFWTIREATTFELLHKEATSEGVEPVSDGGGIVCALEGLFGNETYFCGGKSVAQCMI